MTEPWLLGRYEIVAELGKGAMGVVYRANDPMLNRILAIKTINTEEAGHEGMAEYEARFYSEAKAAGSLNHPNIIIIYDIGKSGHLVYMAMESIEGRELREMLAQGQSLPVVQAVDIAAQVGEGRAYAHQHHDHAGRAGENRRLRHRPHALERNPHPDRRDHGVAQVHFARTGRGKARRSSLGHLFARGHPLRVPDRVHPLQRG